MLVIIGWLCMRNGFCMGVLCVKLLSGIFIRLMNYWKFYGMNLLKGMRWCLL